MPESLPLFPLHHCLLPGISLRLQIFEQRYLTLVRDSLKNNQSFGVVPIRKGREVGMVPEIYSWGTLVDIRDWYQLDNRLLGIVVAGIRRFHVESASARDDDLLEAEVRIFAPDPLLPLTDDHRDMQALLAELVQHAGASLHDTPGAVEDVASLGWQLASLLPLSMPRKQALLALDDPVARSYLLRRWLQRMAED